MRAHEILYLASETLHLVSPSAVAEARITLWSHCSWRFSGAAELPEPVEYQGLADGRQTLGGRRAGPGRPLPREPQPPALASSARKKKLGRMRPKKKLGRVRPKKKLGRIGQLWELWQPLCQLPVVCQLQQFAGCTSSSAAGGLPSSASLCSQPRRASGCGCGGVPSARALSA